MGTGIGDVAYMSRRELNAQGVDDRSIPRAMAAGEVDRIRLGEYAAHRELSAREFSLAQTLLEHAGQVLTREQLLSRVWGYDFDPNSNVVDVYIRYLRRKLGAARIETVRGVGYRLR